MLVMSEADQQLVSIEFKVHVGQGSFTANATVPAGQTNLTAILPVIQSIEDSLMNGVSERMEAEGTPVTCKAGCGACCRQLVPISFFEAETLANWMRTLTMEELQALERRFDRTLTALDEAGMLERLEQVDWLGNAEAARQLCMDYLKLRIPCPFLQDESCSIHPIRPLICREYLVISPPERCVDPSELGAVPVGIQLHLSRVLNVLSAKIDPAGKGWMPLPALYDWMEKDLHPGEAVAGPGAQVLYTFVSHLSDGEVPEDSPEAAAETSPDAE